MSKYFNAWRFVVLFAAVMAGSLSAQNFTKESLLETNIPVIEISIENNAGITSKDYYVNIESFTVTDPTNSKNNFSRRKQDAARPELDRPADQIRGRGNASWAKPEWNLNYPKKPYRIRFTKQVEVLGLGEARNWVLLAEYRDPTFLSNSLAFELAKNVLEMPFSHNYRYAHLFLNGDYRGLYGLTEHKQVHKNRIDIDPDEGWYVNIDSYYDEEPKFQTVDNNNNCPSMGWPQQQEVCTNNYNLPVMIKSPELEPENMGNPGYNFVREDWKNLTNKMASGFPENGYRDLIDINALIDYLIVNEVTKNEELGNDNNIRSFLAYKDKGKKITAGPVWDFDCGYGYDYNSTHRYFMGNNQFIAKVSFLQRFYDDPVFKVRFRERWNEKYGQIGDITNYVENAGQKIRSAVAKDTEKWLANGNMDQNNGYVASEYIADYSNAVNQLKSWLNNRIQWLNGQINSQYTGKINISSAVVTFSEPSYYDGAPKTPQVVVESYGKKLTERTHYTLSYSNNINIGEASVTITGIGDYYEGSKSENFKITDGETPIIHYPLPAVASKAPSYYTIKGEPVGSAKPVKPGVYLVKQGSSVKKIVVK